MNTTREQILLRFEGKNIEDFFLLISFFIWEKEK